MTNARRLEIYLRNGRPLTTAQARRWRHHNHGQPNAPHAGTGVQNWELGHAWSSYRRAAYRAYREDLARTEAGR